MNNKIPDNFCMAPWTHAMHDTHYVRRLCCISAEPPEYLRSSYISLEEFKNSDYVKDIRKQMMAGIMPRDCEWCDINAGKQGHVDLYKDTFNRWLGTYYNEALSKTDKDGHTTMDTKNFDYRFGDICNFKCRHCSSRSSSQIKHEEQQYDIVPAWGNQSIPFDTNSADDLLLNELLSAADKGDIQLIQWIGGEPLFSEHHWKAMNYLNDNCDCSNIELSYITNLSIIEFKGKKLVDLVKNFRNVHIHASIESGGISAEYIRTGMNWAKWKDNFKQIKTAFDTINSTTPSSINFVIAPGITLTTFSLPGLAEFLDLLIENNSDLCNVTFHKPNPNNVHFDIDSLGPYKKMWLDEFLKIVESRRSLLKPRTYFDLIKAHKLLLSQKEFDFDNLENKNFQNQLKRSVEWANKTDTIRKTYAADVIKDYPFMVEWWTKLNSL
jgi:MoaA/NifB/PqqE/SkfB family radical SAM enzyme